MPAIVNKTNYQLYAKLVKKHVNNADMLTSLIVNSIIKKQVQTINAYTC